LFFVSLKVAFIRRFGPPEHYGTALPVLCIYRYRPSRLSPTAFANNFIINSAVHLYNTRMRENLHLDPVSINYGKRTVRHKASKIWNQLPSSLKEFFFSVKYFSNKLKEFLQVVDMDSIFNV